MKATTHFITLNETKYFYPTRELLVTLDIKSLYTNIPQTEGIKVITNHLNCRPATGQVHTDFIIYLLAITLTKNYFLFKGKYYSQYKSTSRGAVFSLNFAILFVEDMETKYILNITNPFFIKYG